MTTPVDTRTCQACGECCRRFPYIEVSQADIDELVRYTGLRPDAFVNAKGETPEVHFLRFRENGDCVFLDEDDGRLSCRVYEARPGICRTYPADSAQDERCEVNQRLSVAYRGSEGSRKKP
jgi:Fe-S-cluster containining protein